MKTMALLSVLILCGIVSAAAQDSKGGSTALTAQLPAKAKEEKKTVVAPPKPSGVILGKRVYYGGYFTDVATAEKKRALFNLKTPIDPNKDLENIWLYPGTDKIQGVTLFSIKF